MITYEIPHFDQLDGGVTALSVPVIADAVQLGALRFTSLTRLAIHAGRAQITIEREDATPLQVQAVSDDEMLEAFRWPILGKPVARLALYKGQREGCWSVNVGSEVQVREPQALGDFLTAVAVFSVEKQLKDARQVAARNLIDKMLTEERVLYGNV